MRFAKIPVLLHADLLWLPPNKKKRRRIYPPNYIFPIPCHFSRPEMKKYSFDALVVYSEENEVDGSHPAKIAFPNGTAVFLIDLKKMGEENEIILVGGCYVLGVCRNLEFVDHEKEEKMGDPF